jgi:ATP-binding cassette subfamily C protein LapB
MNLRSASLIRLPSARFEGGPDVQTNGLGPIFASFLINLLSLAMPLVILQVYDRIIPNQAYGTLTLLIAGLAFALVLDAMLRVIRAYILGWSGARFEHLMSNAAVGRLLHADSAAYERDASGIHLARINAIDTLREFHSGQAKALLVDLPFVALFLLLIWFVAGSLVLVPIALLGLLGLASVALAKRLKGALKNRNRIDEHRHNFIIEVLDGIHTVKGLSMEAPMQRRYERLQESAAMATYDTALLSNLAQGLGALFSNVTLVAVAAAGALYVVAGNLSIGGLAACTLLAGRIMQPVLRAAGLATQLESVAIATDRVAELFRIPREAGGDIQDLPEITGAIEFRNVSYRHDQDGKDVLRDINLKIEAGEMIAILGGAGSGKSTLLSLMTRMALPTKGEVLFDGVSTANLDPEKLRGRISYLAQSPVLMRGTIMENLALFRKGEAIDDAMKAGHLLGLDKVVNLLPRGYDTMVGDGAAGNLAAGVIQSIANARALAGDKPVILFDEAQMGLDVKSDQELNKALVHLKGKATVVLVTYRPSLIGLADRRFELRDGTLHAVPAPGTKAPGTGGSQATQPMTSRAGAGGRK